MAVHLADGLSTDAIATSIGISEATVRSHLKRSFEKMEVNSRPELIHRVMSGPLGWLMTEMGSPMQDGTPATARIGTGPETGPGPDTNIACRDAPAGRTQPR